MGVEVRLAGDRGREVAPGRETRHSFSFGATYDPLNVMFGPLVCHNDDRLDPGAGYPEHAHSDVEIVTWVLSGALVHTDSLGHRSVLGPGDVQVQSAGAGIRHSEIADRASGPTRFVQAWLRPDSFDLPPTRHLGTSDPHDLGAGLGAELVPLVGGLDGLPLAAQGATLLLGRPAAGWSGRLPDASGCHLFVASGAVRIETSTGPVQVAAGDAVRLRDEAHAPVTALADSELLVWSFA